MKDYFQKRYKLMIMLALIVAIYNLYFIFLLQIENFQYLLYIDFLVGISLLAVLIYDIYKWIKISEKKAVMLAKDMVICDQFNGLPNLDIAQHDIAILQSKLQLQKEITENLQDYMAKWCHEAKMPLAALLMINENIEDMKLRNDQLIQLERIKQLVNMAMVGCKVQSQLFDLKFKKIALIECVNTAIRNQRFFLIKEHFSIEIAVDELYVYSDQEWLVYVLDQLIANAIKYHAQKPCLKIYGYRKDNRTSLFVEDHGEGIKKEDIKDIFNRGFTGTNKHNGQYRSTGMGLYFVWQILEKLGHRIYVESEEGSFTRFEIVFWDNSEYLFL